MITFLLVVCIGLLIACTWQGYSLDNRDIEIELLRYKVDRCNKTLQGLSTILEQHFTKFEE